MGKAGGTDGLRRTKPKPRKDAKGGHKGKATSEDFSYTQNREVSWLRFDDRVLDEAFDETKIILSDKDRVHPPLASLRRA